MADTFSLYFILHRKFLTPGKARSYFSFSLSLVGEEKNVIGILKLFDGSLKLLSVIIREKKYSFLATFGKRAIASFYLCFKSNER